MAAPSQIVNDRVQWSPPHARTARVAGEAAGGAGGGCRWRPSRAKARRRRGAGAAIVQICCQPLGALVKQCLQVLRIALAPRTYLSVLHAVASPCHFAGAQSAEPPANGGGAEQQWRTFCAALCDVLGCRAPAGASAQRAKSPSAAAAPSSAASDDWSALLRSTHHQRLAARAPLRGLLPVQPEPEVDPPEGGGGTAGGGAAGGPAAAAVAHGSCAPNEIERVLTELHEFYEAMKLDALSWPQLYPLATLLATVAARLKRWEHAYHYARDFGTLGPAVERLARLHPPPTHSAAAAPSAVLHLPLPRVVACGTALPRLAAAAAAAAELFAAARQARRGWRRGRGRRRRGHHGGDAAPMRSSPRPAVCHRPCWPFTDVSRCTAPAARRPFRAVAPPRRGCYGGRIAPLLARGIARPADGCGEVGPKHLEVLPLGVALPLQDAIRTCRHRAPEGLSLRAYDLIGRHDLARQQQQSDEARPAPIALPPAAGSAGGYLDDVDGMGAVLKSSALLFAADLRLNEVRRMLNSSRPLALRLSASPDLSDHDLLHEQQTRLMLLCRRSMALPVGRGMFSLASAPPRLTEALRMAPLTLKGRMPANAATIDLDLSALPSDQLHWPEFHNGTAAALRLCPPGCGPSDEGELGRNWIVYNKPRAHRQHGHAGFLLGLGLQGHLLALANTDLYRYMSQGHDVTMMAVLLGWRRRDAARCTTPLPRCSACTSRRSIRPPSPSSSSRCPPSCRSPR